MLLSRRSGENAATLIEAVMAAGMSALFLGSLFAMNTSSMATIKIARESAAASQVLQQRVESLRIANWHNVTDPDWLKNNLLNTDASGTTGLKGVTETLMLVPYGSSTPGNVQLVRTRGVATIASRIPLLGENAVKVVWTLNFTGAPNDRPVSRQMVAILAKGGVAK